MGSPLNHQRTCRDALPSPCFWVVWPGPEIWFLWLLLLGIPPKRAVVLVQEFLPQLVVANLLLCGLSPFLQESWEGCVHPVGCTVCQRILCSWERSWGLCCPHGLATP